MRNSKKLLFILVTVMLVLGGTTAYAAVTGFTDIAGTTHETSIVWAVDNGITIGYADGTFRPNNPNTRGQMTTFLNRFYNNLVKPLDTRVSALEAGGGTNTLSGCKDCHNATDLVSSKQEQWSTSKHGTGTVFIEDGSNPGCQFCHSGGAFSTMVKAGLSPDTTSTANVADMSPSRQDCRTCHKIHETGTGADWALETVAPVKLFATPGQTFDGGAGNLCANCHQARRAFPAANAAGIVTGISTHWGPHHGPQADMLLGLAGASATGASLTGSPMAHYTSNDLNDTCVSCHVADPASHTFDPKVSVCEGCHTTDDFNVGNEQTEVKERLDAIATALAAITATQADGTQKPLLVITTASGVSPSMATPV